MVSRFPQCSEKLFAESPPSRTTQHNKRSLKLSAWQAHQVSANVVTRVVESRSDTLQLRTTLPTLTTMATMVVSPLELPVVPRPFIMTPHTTPTLTTSNAQTDTSLPIVRLGQPAHQAIGTQPVHLASFPVVWLLRITIRSSNHSPRSFRYIKLDPFSTQCSSHTHIVKDILQHQVKTQNPSIDFST